MIVGYDFLGDSGAVHDNRIALEVINSVEIKNGLYDELMLKNGYDEFNINRDEWTYSTTLLAKFRNNLEAGNIGFGDGFEGYIEIRKRKIEDLNDWQLVGRVDYKNESRFYFYDELVEAGQTYEYALVPVSKNELGQVVEGDAVTKTVTADFEDTFLIDTDKSIKLRYDLDLNDMERVRKVSLIEGLYSKYPIFTSSAKVSYDRGSIDAKLVSDRNRDRIFNGQGVDSRSEMMFRESVKDFISNDNIKFLKFPDGKVYLVVTSESYNWNQDVDFGRDIADINFDWTEIADINDENLIKYGLIKGSDIK